MARLGGLARHGGTPQQTAHARADGAETTELPDGPYAFAKA